MSGKKKHGKRYSEERIIGTGLVGKVLLEYKMAQDLERKSNALRQLFW